MTPLKIPRTDPHSNFVVKFKLYPNRDQASRFQQNCNARRFIWNYQLEQRLKDYENWKAGVPTVEHLTLAKLKKKEGLEWLETVDAQSLRQAQMDLDKAWFQWHKDRARTDGKQGKSKPRFCSRNSDRQSFRVQQSMEVDKDCNSIRIGKHKWVRARGSFNQVPKTGSIQSITVTKRPSGWYASVLFRIPPVTLKNDFPYESVGIDLGVKIPLACSYSDQGLQKEFKTGIKFSEELRKRELRLKKLQRQLSRKKKGSKNRARTRNRLSVQYERITNFKRNWQDQTSFKLSSLFETVVFEDLKLSRMTRKVKTVKDSEGNELRDQKTGKRAARKSVSAKSGLNRELLRLGLATLVAKVESKKSRRFGGSVKKVDPRFTSQTCSSCGSIDKESRVSQSRYQCVSCGFSLNADFNAARNILSKGCPAA